MKGVGWGTLAEIWTAEEVRVPEEGKKNEDEKKRRANEKKRFGGKLEEDMEAEEASGLHMAPEIKHSHGTGPTSQHRRGLLETAWASFLESPYKMQIRSDALGQLCRDEVGW